MAEVATDVHATIDHYLDYLFDEWADIPQLAAEWPKLERHDQLDFIHEWPIKESYLARLREYVEQDLLTSAQRDRQEQLLRLVHEHRPTAERLLRG